MASTPNTTKKASSRWGSFLAGVESRLDTILADEDPSSSSQKKEDGGLQTQIGMKEALAVSKARDGVSRTPSTSKAQEHLNERLAKAMAAKNVNKTGGSSVTTSGLPSRTASPANGADSPRISSDSKAEEPKSEDARSLQDSVASSNGAEGKDVPVSQSQEPTSHLNLDVPNEGSSARPSLDSRGSFSSRQSLDLTRDVTTTSVSPKLNGAEPDMGSTAPNQFEETIQQMRADYEASEIRRQEENHAYLERIDALQSKLQYLTKEAAEIAKINLSKAQPGSIDHKLAIKDEKIALLMEEGHKLSQTELKHMSVIKNMRHKSIEDAKQLADAKRIAAKHERSAREAHERAKRAELAEKRASERTKSLPKLERELETLRIDRDAKASVIQDLQRQLASAQSIANEAHGKVQVEDLEEEQRRTAQLLDDISSLRTEKELSEKRHQNELREAREKIERERERAKVAEIERQGEQNMLESRLETFRARAEEASTGSSGDTQAKLLRQIETLQNQYAVASENWQGIEGSLLSRITALEKERDDVMKREADIRRKGRETNIKTRRLEEDLERATAKIEDLEYELSSRSSELENFHRKLLKSEASLAQAEKDLQSQKEAFEVRLSQRLEEERSRLQREEPASRTPDTLYQHFRTDSPPHNRKSSVADKSNTHTRRLQGLAITGPSSLDRTPSRHSSSQPLHSTDFRSPSRQESFSSIPQLSINGGPGERRSPHRTESQDGFFDDPGTRTPATPDRTLNDLISVSTVGAGPSVQLVSSMSAAVRRLESEKADLRDEVARLVTQRDESREQVVDLMKEVEQKRGMEGRVSELEKEVKSVGERYETTLEMLGERSERVEELTQDVGDLKAMYRDLVEKTMK